MSCLVMMKELCQNLKLELKTQRNYFALLFTKTEDLQLRNSRLLWQEIFSKIQSLKPLYLVL